MGLEQLGEFGVQPGHPLYLSRWEEDAAPTPVRIYGKKKIDGIKKPE